MAAESWKMKLYNRSPVWLQNVLTSAYGWQRHRERHGGEWAQSVAFFMESQWWDEERLRRYQLDRLKALVRHAMNHVPYFRERYNSLGIQADELEAVSELPILEKETLRTRMDDLVSPKWDRSELLEYHTSGSTGTPLTYLIQRDDHRERMALLERQRRWAGVREGDRCATFTGSLIIPRGHEDGPLWRYNHFGRQMLFSTYHLTRENLPRCVARLAAFRPAIIEGYPSALQLLARWVNRHPEAPRPSPAAILATGETLLTHQRETIEAGFGAKVYDYYGSSEAAPMITECEAGQLHINPESGIFEVLTPRGHPAAPGELGELVVTSFQTRAMPLIRYRIRDAAVLSETGACECGRHMPRVESILGRLDDMIYAPDRGWVGRLSQAVKVFPGSVKEAQIVQDDPRSVRIRLVVDEERFEKAQLPPLLSDLRSRLGEVLEIHVEYREEIPRGANNKFRYVVSNLSDEDRSRIERGELAE